MNKALPVVAIVLLALIAALLIWKFSGPDPVPPPIIDNDPAQNIPFEAADFIDTFDVDGDRSVSLEEFKQRYGVPLEDGKPELVMQNPKTGKPLNAEDAFKLHWDRDSNGVVDARDIELISDSAWLAFHQKTKRAGLTPVRYDGKFYGLNEHQQRTMEAEVGAAANNEVPFAGQFWAKKYFQSWVKVEDAAGETLEGFAYEGNGRIYILSSNASLTVKDPAKVTIQTIDDAPQTKYAKAVVGLSFIDGDANLALANKCMEWGMKHEAGMLYARVLITQPDNKTALDALGFKRVEGKFVRKEE